MPVAIPRLDDRTYAQLVDEGRLLIPAFAPRWTNHNPSDPGIALIELFAYFTELLLFSLDQLTERDLLAFVRLLNGPDWDSATAPDLRQALAEAVVRVRTPNRAVTAADYESLALRADARIARAHCVPRRDLTATTEPSRRADRPGHVSVLVVPLPEHVSAAAEIVDKVRDYLEPRRLVTTRIHVAQPRKVAIGVEINVVLKPGASATQVRARVVSELRRFLDPLAGGQSGAGWEFGRPVYVSEVLRLLDGIEGVDYVTRSIDPETGRVLDELKVADEEVRRLQRNQMNDLAAVSLQVDELVEPDVTEDRIHIVDPEFRGGGPRRR